MLISGREASFRLELAGLTRRRARQVLAAGLAGEPRVTRSVLWFEEDPVNELAAWPVLDEEELDRMCPKALFIGRRDVRVGAPEAERRGSMEPGWGFSPYTAVWLRTRIKELGFVPFVATVCGFVAVGAEITDVIGGNDSRSLTLRRPGPWFDSLSERRIQVGPGRPWAIRGWQPAGRSVGQSGRQPSPHRQEPA